MAHLEPGSGQSISPTSSGRASPITRKWTTGTVVAFPSRAIVAKRLAQCLNPSLPSGVHQKALEVYAYIFTLIGKDSLSRDLPLYFPGLASTLSFASLSVRTPFLDLLEKHMLKLDAGALRPALKAIILSVLPGLEEETSEEFERTLKLLDEFKHSVRSTRGDDLGHDHNKRARPFRICLSLMDRWEIGGLVVPEIFLPVVDSVRKYKDIASTKDDFSEVLRSASVFFDGVESGLIWGEIVGLIAQAIEPGSATVLERKDKLSLVKFILAHFNVREEEMLVIHAPLATLTILAMLKEAVERPGSHSDGASLSDDVTQMALNTAIDLFDFIPERAFQDRPSTTEPPIAKKTEETESLKHTAESLRIIQTFYVQDQGNLDAIPPPFSIRVVSGLLFREIAVITTTNFKI
ncbi:putative protein dopey [Glarea lozoyensis 74030]|uniref:Uncharacterized protein n=1 Tax=Glarea lozoyensis (strain ATCC 74030 / MF5533) TaxID=1104152 RepID=H0ECX0_GLAL7|nr:putative protein dopey [Glarea lozoyensis 74030]